MKNLFRILTIAFLVVSTNAISQNWVTKTNMPTSRSNAASCVLNNKIYVVGGENGSNIYNMLQVYDPQTNSWNVKTPMSVPRNDLAVATVNGKIYAIGGYSSGAKVGTVEEYNPITDSWTTKTSMPTTRCTFSVGVINNKIYAIGGWSGNYTTVEEYTPATDSWATKTPIPEGRGSDNSIQVLGNNLYYIGGKNINTNAPLSSCYKYNQSTDTWSAIANIPQAVWAGATATIGNKIHYFGGGNGNESIMYNYHFVYDTLTNLWTSEIPMTSTRADFCAETVNGNIYLIGGRDSTLTSTNLVEELFFVSTGIKTANDITNLNIYPNPASDHIYINCGNYTSMTGYTIKINNAIGQTVYSSLVNQQLLNIDLNTLSGKGIYFINILDTGNNVIDTKKILLQ